MVLLEHKVQLYNKEFRVRVRVMGITLPSHPMVLIRQLPDCIFWPIFIKHQAKFILSGV